jgi:16S rRNA (guanine527-N7)-methyltransferase
VETSEIAHLLAPFVELESDQLRQVATHLDLLLKWNSKVNLTSVRQPQEIVTRHFGESFFAARQLLSAQDTGLVADVGSGAGFPVIPLAIWAPRARTVLIESNGKKAAFLNEVAFALKLANAKVFEGRAESYSQNAADLVTMRAVEKFDNSLAVAIGLVKPGGRIGLMIGQAQVDHTGKLAEGLDWSQPMPLPGGHSRVLLVGTKPVTVE